MQVKEIMSRHAQTVTPETTIFDVAEVMQRLDTGFVPVGEDDRLVGTVTDRDIVVKGLAARKAGDTPVSEVMAPDILYCIEDQEVGEVARNMGERQVRRMPVLNRDKRLVGIVSLGDLSTEGDAQAAGSALRGISD